MPKFTVECTVCIQGSATVEAETLAEARKIAEKVTAVTGDASFMDEPPGWSFQEVCTDLELDGIYEAEEEGVAR